jgi:hypothetical protein
MGIGFLINQGFDLVGAFDFRRAVGITSGFLGFEELPEIS